MWHVTAISLILDLLKFKNIENGVILNCNSSNDNIVFFQKTLNENNMKVSSFQIGKSPTLDGFSKIGLVLDASCELWNNTLDLVDETYFRSSYTWLIKTDDLASTVDAWSKFPIEINSDVILITKGGEPNVFYLHEVYNKGFYTKGSLVVRNLGYWASKLYLKQKERYDLTGVVLKCVVVVVDPIVNQTFEQYLEQTKPEDSIVDSLHKLKFFTIVKYLANMYNFR
ncbi:uncharacterized protein LOC128199247 [Bicyclus anynana]|uniref:Uncharacterized protein LOC128199247 n=1 Tax=Bicyclus anynana TaxID=110368 RepID=A0ABM3LY13_BICAN|nr:uncharacterized protein LOC128199247 [Bicyclus anynana]